MVTYPADKSREAMPTLSPRACGEREGKDEMEKPGKGSLPENYNAVVPIVVCSSLNDCRCSQSHDLQQSEKNYTVCIS